MVSWRFAIVFLTAFTPTTSLAQEENDALRLVLLQSKASVVDAGDVGQLALTEGSADASLGSSKQRQFSEDSQAPPTNSGEAMANDNHPEFTWPFYTGNASLSPAHYLFFAHHKTGTALSENISTLLSNITGAGHAHIVFRDVRDVAYFGSDRPTSATFDVACPGGSGGAIAAVYEDMRVPFLDRILAGCRPMRAVHLVRDLPEALISSYVYTKGLNVKPSNAESDKLEARGPLYRNISVKEGLRVDCGLFSKTYTTPMVEVHEKIARENISDVLEVRLEDIENDYDSTVRSIFEHFLGRSHSMLPELQSRAKAFDINRWSDAKVDSSLHVHDDSEKVKARKEFWNMISEGDSCANEMLLMTHRLGYRSRMSDGQPSLSNP